LLDLLGWVWEKERERGKRECRKKGLGRVWTKEKEGEGREGERGNLEKVEGRDYIVSYVVNKRDDDPCLFPLTIKSWCVLLAVSL